MRPSRSAQEVLGNVAGHASWPVDLNVIAEPRPKRLQQLQSISKSNPSTHIPDVRKELQASGWIPTPWFLPLA